MQGEMRVESEVNNALLALVHMRAIWASRKALYLPLGAGGGKPTLYTYVKQAGGAN
jgi:hypothetical protein